MQNHLICKYQSVRFRCNKETGRRRKTDSSESVFILQLSFILVSGTLKVHSGIFLKEPEFSGYVQYENTFIAKESWKMDLEITDAYEGVEVFVNDVSLGIQIVPAFLETIRKYSANSKPIFLCFWK